MFPGERALSALRLMSLYLLKQPSLHENTFVGRVTHSVSLRYKNRSGKTTPNFL